MRATHALSLYVHATPEDFARVHDRLSLQGKVFVEEGLPIVTVSSHQFGDAEVDDDDDHLLICDEDTMAKVHAAIVEGLSPFGLMDSKLVATDIINQIQNHGILFRERRS